MSSSIAMVTKIQALNVAIYKEVPNAIHELSDHLNKALQDLERARMTSEDLRSKIVGFIRYQIV
jgi:3-hydroxyacyl-CoA dehydrogenase